MAQRGQSTAMRRTQSSSEMEIFEVHSADFQRAATASSICKERARSDAKSIVWSVVSAVSSSLLASSAAASESNENRARDTTPRGVINGLVLATACSAEAVLSASSTRMTISDGGRIELISRRRASSARPRFPISAYHAHITRLESAGDGH